ncbi:hypothetical protein MIMGU_mgv1a0085832mg, partial [Erythranthe guttata]
MLRDYLCLLPQIQFLGFRTTS